MAAIGFKNGLIKLIGFGNAANECMEHCLCAHENAIIHLVFVHSKCILISLDN